MLEQIEIPEHTREKLREDAKTVKISAFKKGVAELERLYVQQQEAAEDFAASVKAIAEKSG